MKNKEMIKINNNVIKSSILSITNDESDLDKGTCCSVLSSSGLANSILPGMKLPAATPAIMERKEKVVVILVRATLYVSNCHLQAFTRILMKVMNSSSKIVENLILLKASKAPLKSIVTIKIIRTRIPKSRSPLLISFI